MKPNRNRKPTLALVTGRPGSGKTTLARVLAKTVSCPLLSRDEIYEGMLRTYAHDPQPPHKSHVTMATFELFFRVMGTLVASDVTFVAEAAFQDERWRIGLEPIIQSADLRVIHCVVPEEVARQRILTRRLEQQDLSLPARVANDNRVADGQPLAINPFVALSLPVPTLRVTTTEGYAPRLDDVIKFITS